MKTTYLLKSEAICWSCSQPTPVACPVTITKSEEAENLVVFSNVESLDNELLAALQQKAPGFKFISRRRVFANTCIHCNSVQGAFFLHSEPDGAFFPIEEEAIAKVSFEKIEGEHTIKGPEGWNGAIHEIFEKAGEIKKLEPLPRRKKKK